MEASNVPRARRSWWRRTPMAPSIMSSSSRATARMITGMPNSFNGGLSVSCRGGLVQLRIVSHDDDPVLVDREEAAVRLDRDPRPVDRLDGHFPGREDRQDGAVPRHDADLAIAGACLDQARRPGPHEVVRGDDFDFEFGHGYLPWISAHWRSTSSSPPMLKKACSAMWSRSPSQMALKPSMVSLMYTVEPSTPVNCLAV